MGETIHDQHTGTAAAAATATTTKTAATTSSKRISGSGGGEIVEVQGGHIVRSTGRKDRHSKVCTAKGPRDRRVRLSAHTAIQFYDVQDRLGYDRPSKAVDWLIKKAKSAIDELAHLPAWNPTATCSSTPQQQQQQQTNEMFHRQSPVDNNPVTASTSHRSAALERRMPPQEQQFPSQQQQLELDYNSSSSGKHGYLQGSLDTDIADTIKSFFPVETPTTSFHSYQQPPDLLSRTAATTQQQDLRLSLQSFQDPIMLQSHHDNHHHNNNHQVLFAGNSSLGYDGGGSASTLWSEQQQQQQEEHDNGRLHRMMAWNANNVNVNAADGGNSGHGAGFVFSTPAPAFGGYGQFITQRGPLQSSYNPSVRAWIDPSMATANIADHHHHYLSPMIHQASVSGGVFSGFRIPARIQGEEEHDGVSDKPSSASSDSRH